MYGQQHAVEDAKNVLDHLKIPKAHIVGLSQGAFATAHFGRCYADRALSLTLAGSAPAPAAMGTSSSRRTR